MNRFTRNNLLLIIIIACTGVAVAGLLVFCIIRYIEMDSCITRIKDIENQVNALKKKTPAPTEKNYAPIEANTKLYKEAADKLAAHFVPPMKAVAEEFVASLKETNPPKTEDGKPEPLTVERFRKDFEEMWGKGQSYVQKQYDYQGFREGRYTNWNAVVRKLLPKAQLLTTEVLTEENLPEMLFAYIGIPRTMGEQPERMSLFMKNYQNTLVKLMTNLKFDLEVTNFGFDADYSAAKLATVFNDPRNHYPQLVRVWNIYGDVLSRLVSCVQKVRYEQNGKTIVEPWTSEVSSRLTGKKYTLFDDRVDTFNGLMLRGAMPVNAKEAVNPENMRKAIAGDEDGPFSIYRMRLKVAGSLTGIRTLVRTLDDAYKAPGGDGNQKYTGKRIYVIKSIALYAEQDGGREIFRRHEEESGIKSTLHSDSTQRSETASRPRRGRGRGRSRAEESQSAETQQQTEQQAAEARAAELKRQQEEASKPFHQRDGYGDIQIGADKRCSAVIDLDCYELK